MNVIGHEGSDIIVSFQDGSFEIWEKQKGICIKRGKHFKEECRSIDISPDLSMLQNQHQYNKSSNTNNNTTSDLLPKNNNNKLIGLQYSQPKLFVLSGSYDSTVMVSAVQQNYSPVFMRKGHRSKVLSTQWHPLRPSFISTSADNSIVYWSPRNIQNNNDE